MRGSGVGDLEGGSYWNGYVRRALEAISRKYEAETNARIAEANRPFPGYGPTTSVR
jgi:hypothetical protein